MAEIITPKMGRLLWSGTPEKPKLRVELGPIPLRADPPDRKCRVCEQVAPGWDFYSFGHPDVCGNCVHGGRRAARLPTTWQDATGRLRDETLLTTMRVVCTALEGKHVGRR